MNISQSIKMTWKDMYCPPFGRTWVYLSNDTLLYLNVHGRPPCFGWKRLDVEALSHSETSQTCSCQWAWRQATGTTPHAPDDFGKTLTATQEGNLFSLLFSQAAAWLKAKWVTLLDTPNQPTALIFHTDGSCVSKQHAAQDKWRGERELEQG